ncbi:Uncharacterized protein GBIM_14288 [Gryllus bimaculatus]|nr:Fbxl-like 1 protein [Gryllus bimaculatus]GLH09175.1 Uncharacterized protein GBIM_14288 [Gryllus bimaculatus]
MPEKTIDDLPYEILLKVCSYLSLEDIILGVRHVNDEWNEVAQDSRLWRHLPYCPSHHTSSSDIINILKQAPKLQVFKPEGYTRKKILEVIIAYCKDIRELDVYIDEVGDTLVSKLVKECRNIESLSVIAIDFEGTKCLKLISKCTKLKTLRLGGNASKSKKNFFADLADGCPSLQVLDLKNFYDYSNDDLQRLLQKKGRNIVSLELRWSSERGRCTLPVVSYCTNLESLHVEEYVDVQTVEGFAALKKIQSLKRLSLPYFRHCNVNYLLDFFKNGALQSLVKLDLTVFENFENSLAWLIFQKCTLLKFLKLVYCPKMTDEGLELIYQLKHLEYLSIAGCDQITDKGVEHISKCVKLKYLNLNSCYKVTSESLVICCQHLKLLQELHINGCNVRTEAVLDVPNQLKYLTLLDVCEKQINKETIMSITKDIGCLRVIYPDRYD